MTTIWHNPKCAKSREAVALFTEKNQEVEIIKYLETTPTRAEIVTLLGKLGISARALMRTKEDIYKELGLVKVEDENLLIDALVQHPKLIERPILIRGNQAIVGRPIEKVIDFLA